MISISQRHAALRAMLQEADGGAMIAGVVGSAVSPAVSRSCYGADIVGVRGGSEGGGRSGRCRRVGVSGRDVGDWRRLGWGWVFWHRQQTPKKPKGPLRCPEIFFHRGHSRQEGGYQEAPPAPRGREGRPKSNVPPENTGPRPAELGKN